MTGSRPSRRRRLTVESEQASCDATSGSVSRRSLMPLGGREAPAGVVHTPACLCSAVPSGRGALRRSPGPSRSRDNGASAQPLRLAVLDELLELAQRLDFASRALSLRLGTTGV